MANLNLVQLIGNLTRDPELTYIPSGTAVVKTCIAVNETWNKDGQKQTSVQFINLTIWGKGGEIFAKYTQKGSPVYVSGKLKIDKVPAKDGSGAFRYFTSVVVANFQFLGRKGEGSGGGDVQVASFPEDEYGDQVGVDPGFASLPETDVSSPAGSVDAEWEIPETSATLPGETAAVSIDDDDIPF